MSHHETSIDQARRHVAEGERHIVGQQRLVDELRRGGHDTTEARKLLETLRRTHAAMKEHLEIEEQTVRQP